MTLGLALGVALGWGLCRAVPGGAERIIQVGRIPPYKPVEIVPESVNWPQGEPVVVATVTPPTKKEARKLEKEFGFRADRDSLLGKFDLPQLPDGGKAVITVPKRGNEDPVLPVKLTVKANKPPLLRIRWEPVLGGWYDSPIVRSVDGNTLSSWSGYVRLNRLICVRDRLCLNARAGYEHRPWGGGAIAGVGVSWRF